MSRQRAASMLASLRFPRVSGDEPIMTVISGALTLFSPRERG